MIKKILRVLITLGGGSLGYIVGKLVIDYNLLSKIGIMSTSSVKGILFIIFCILLFLLFFYFISAYVTKLIIKTIDCVEKRLQKLPTADMLLGLAGAVLGLIVASLLANLVKANSAISTIIVFIVTVILVVVCADMAIRKKEDILNLFSNMKKGSTSKDGKLKNIPKGTAKVLDTSVIIDGRIFDLCQTGFIEGTLVIPNFVLDELRHIADSGDGLKRNRGRRGLDILNKIQKELSIKVEIWEGDFPEIAEVDSKLLKLSQVLNGKVITNDYNLNKVAEVQGVPVLNINELANAIKPVVLPGEDMKIQIVKDGKESGQGLAYLDDGTMIVVEDGRNHIGDIVIVTVTSVLQTAAGRMIFARIREEVKMLNGK
ncbi:MULTISPECIES: PIN/TRAM domain-containing protein [Clostridium]|uniref:PIN/TRAM domain-containing protein n=1 Tax=Clostridium senegalense TaxID=1465809 RepID=A0A6M0H9V9_9CLOT|nr:MULTISPECIES: PIN/TRAM domain-containing protein [Clostridium]MBU5226952.1 PIN/TRAM domain-containing protein [Clostridium senegalense]NEU06422.1 PIN/TRAM domain-containing protein [Clostridium senegalense]